MDTVLKPFIMTFIFIMSFIPTASAEIRMRPEVWAKLVIGSELDNLYKVDDGIYRSEQPDDEEFEALVDFGIKEVLNLREYHSDNDETQGLAIKLNRLTLATGKVNEDDLISALKIIQSAKQQNAKILVHCWHGADRTGAVIAAYRIIFNHWTKADALDEMNNGGFGYHNNVYPNLVELIENLDVKRIKKALAI